jgi:putative flippase GtrA
MTSGSAASLIDRVRSLLRDRALMAKALSFACIGVVNTLVDFGLFSFTHLYLGLPIVVANAISWTVAVTGSYVMNSLITFAAESERKLRAKPYVGFVAAQIAGFVANTATVLVASLFMHVLIGKALAIGVSFLVNFSLSHFVVFRPSARSRPAP